MSKTNNNSVNELPNHLPLGSMMFASAEGSRVASSTPTTPAQPSQQAPPRTTTGTTPSTQTGGTGSGAPAPKADEQKPTTTGDQRKVLGMKPVVGVAVITGGSLLLAGGAIWLIVAATKKDKKG